MNHAQVAHHLLVGKICCKSPGNGQGGVQSQSLYPGALDSHPFSPSLALFGSKTFESSASPSSSMGLAPVGDNVMRTLRMTMIMMADTHLGLKDDTEAAPC